MILFLSVITFTKLYPNDDLHDLFSVFLVKVTWGPMTHELTASLWWWRHYGMQHAWDWPNFTSLFLYPIIPEKSVGVSLWHKLALFYRNATTMCFFFFLLCSGVSGYFSLEGKVTVCHTWYYSCLSSRFLCVLSNENYLMDI